MRRFLLLSGLLLAMPVAATAPEVVATAYYTASGVRVSEPTGASPAVYIVVRTHADGSTTAAKVVR